MTTQDRKILLIQSEAYHPIEETSKLCRTFLEKQQASFGDRYISLPFEYLASIPKQLEHKEALYFGLDALLNCDENSFTASVAGKIAKKTEASFVIVGSAQERFLCHQETEHLNRKVKAALQENVVPFLCIGDTEHEFHDGQSPAILAGQLKQLIEGLSPAQLKGLHIIYDASWITQGLWEPKNNEYKKALHTFEEVVKEAVEPSIFETWRLIPSVPAFSSKLPDVLDEQKHFSGYSFGLLDLSIEHTKPLTAP